MMMRTVYPRLRMRIAILATIALAVPAMGWGQSAPDDGRPFVPPVPASSVYGIRPPSAAPTVQRHIVEAADGVDLYVETWLPAAKGGSVPPQRVPTVLVMTPYAMKNRVRYSYQKAMGWLVPRGYAYSVMHLRGTGSSGGCMILGGPQDADDGARVIEYLGRDAPWSSGVVGSFGYSYAGTTQLAVAAMGVPAKTQYLKAMVVGAPVSSGYEGDHFDGVPRTLGALFTEAIYTDFSMFPYAGPLGAAIGDRSWQDFVAGRTAEGGNTTTGQVPERLPCHPDNLAAALDGSGDYTKYWQERDARIGVGNITAATLMFHGHLDATVPTLHQAGFFDRISAPKAGLFGVFAHELPDEHSSGVRPEWERADFEAMVVAWYDRFLNGTENGVDDWPVAQVQGTDGQWRSEPDWPGTGGPVGQLALSAGVLGSSAPVGSSLFTESLPFDKASPVQDPNGSVVFETAPLPERLEITGQPVLDVWVTLNKPDAHLAAELEAFDAAGDPIVGGSAVGFRSMRHLEPLVENRFAQVEGKPAAVGVPIRVSLRFNPTDIVVPAGGRLRLTIAGTRTMSPGIEGAAGLPVSIFEQPSEPSYSFTTVTILHDCEHVSALRFLMPRANPDLLNVREPDEPTTEPLADNRPFVAPVSDAGGLATSPVCGQAPIRLENFGPEIAYGAAG
jgi:predicted acyl esterase